MKKWILIVAFCMLLVGCGSNLENKEIDDFVKNSEYAIIVEKLDKVITNISMFPAEEAENEFIYYVQAIKHHKDKFTTEELDEIYNKLLVSYNFEYNSLGYSVSDFEEDLKVLEK